MTEEEFAEKHIPKQGEIIEYDGVEYMVHDSSRVGSQFLNQEALSEESSNTQYEAISTADQIPFYNLDPVQIESVYNLTEVLLELQRNNKINNIKLNEIISVSDENSSSNNTDSISENR
jgi:hypothetical protein